MDLWVDLVLLVFALFVLSIPLMEWLKDHREERKRRQQDLEDERSGR